MCAENIMNAGDTVNITLDYTIDGTPIEELELDEIEFSFCKKSYLLSAGDIAKDEVTGKYNVTVGQDATLGEHGIGEYQVRFKVDGAVVSDKPQDITIGRSLSSEVI